MTRQELIETIPTHRTVLFKFAIKLTHNIATAEDLLQDTYVMAIAGIHGFRPGTNLAAWLFTIMRNKFRTDLKRKFRSVEDPDEQYMGSLKTQPDQISSLNCKEFSAALAKIEPSQREALILVALYGFRYDEAALICNTEIGTIKSRVSRARVRLRKFLPEEDSLFIAAAGAHTGSHLIDA